ncbi:MAG: M56 family metallopeptidase [Thermoanaerobaculia bacterium]|nr:M56 family metallopeptidase [Thermoanaerobaculia bacterium]
MNAVWELFTRADRIRELSEAMIVWSVKGTLVLAFAGATAWFLRRSTARTRHLAWALAVVGVLLLPGVEGLIPGWSIQGFFPATTGSEPDILVVEPTPIPVVRSQDCTGAPTAVGEGRIPPPSSTARTTSGTRTAWAATAPAPGFTPLVENGPKLLLAVWLLGVMVFAVRPLAGIVRRRRILLAARPASPRARKLLRELRADLGISRPVYLVRVSEAVVPMTWGTLRPVIVLPEASEDWPRTRLRHILLHELAHAARCDACLFAAARLLCVARWFDPLAWYAARRLRAEAELACDDRVLLADDRAALYAGHLLESVREARTATPAGAIAMARSSQLGSRIEAILEPGRRLRPSRRALLASAVAAVAVLIPLSALTLSDPPPPPELPEAPPAPEWTWNAPEPFEPSPPEAPLPESPSLPPASLPVAAGTPPGGEFSPPLAPGNDIKGTIPSLRAPESPLPRAPGSALSAPLVSMPDLPTPLPAENPATTTGAMGEKSPSTDRCDPGSAG